MCEGVLGWRMGTSLPKNSISLTSIWMNLVRLCKLLAFWGVTQTLRGFTWAPYARQSRDHVSCRRRRVKKKSWEGLKKSRCAEDKVKENHFLLFLLLTLVSFFTQPCVISCLNFLVRGNEEKCQRLDRKWRRMKMEKCSKPEKRRCTAETMWKNWRSSSAELQMLLQLLQSDSHATAVSSTWISDLSKLLVRAPERRIWWDTPRCMERCRSLDHVNARQKLKPKANLERQFSQIRI